jgi:hypothetical protein
VPRFGISGAGSFQLQLHGDGALELHWLDATLGNADYDGGGVATVGIQDATGGPATSENALQWSCNT